MSYTAGIIGAGGIAGLGILGLHDEADIGQKKFTASHAGGYGAVDEIDLVAVADVDTNKLNRFGDAWDIPDNHRYEGHEAMLAAEDLDVVSVCSPTFLHADHVVDAVRSPANPDLIWCEKPIASSVTDAKAAKQACAETNTQLLINHSLRFTDKMQALREQIQDGILGDIRSVSGIFRREFLRNAPHLLDTTYFLTEKQPKTVSGFINNENDAVDSLESGTSVEDAGGGGHIVTEDDTFVTVDCTVARDISTMSFQFIGTNGKISLNNDDGEWRYWDLTDEGHIEREISAIEGDWNWHTDYEKSFPNAASHVVDLLGGSAENISPPDDAITSLEIIVGMYISHYSGTHVSLPLETPLEDVTITSW
jgi:predicted dehydrogenase